MHRLIDADALEKEIKRVYCTGCNDYHGLRCRACDTDDALDMIDDAPTVDAEPVRHGRWTEPYRNDIWDCYECSCCGEKYDRTWNYCPRCGAKMDLEDKRHEN